MVNKPALTNQFFDNDHRVLAANILRFGDGDGLRDKHPTYNLAKWYFPDDGSGMSCYHAYATRTFQANYRRADGVHQYQCEGGAISAGWRFIGPDWHFTPKIMNCVRETYPNTKFEVLYSPHKGSRNLDQAQGSIVLPMQMGFPRNRSSHLVGITGYSTWEKQARLPLAKNVT